MMESSSSIEFSSGVDVRIEANYFELSKCVAKEIATLAAAAIEQCGTFTLVLSGGETPIGVYDELSRLPVEWPKVKLFWSDERCVPKDDEQSNFHMVKESLLAKINIPPENIHRIQAELASSELAAQLYEDELRDFFGRRGQMQSPVFDLVILGLGREGHTASLFLTLPPSQISTSWISSVWVEKLKAFRITMTPRLINGAREAFVLVSGSKKADIVARILESNSAHEYPIQEIRLRSGKTTWFLDHDSAARLRAKKESGI
jgi:6-phosphogluconolactonase